jgi:hypothetical protein
MRRTRPLLFFVLACTVIAVRYAGKRAEGPPAPVAKIVDRRPELLRVVADQEKESAQAVANYVPTNKTRIDDLDHPVVDMLRQLPGVLHVEISVPAQKPTCRIIHLRDLHFAPKDLCAIDLRDVYSRELTAEEIDLSYEQVLLEVEAVQLELMALLQCLIDHHGLKRIFAEGVTAKDYAIYLEAMSVIGDMENNHSKVLRKDLVEIRERLARVDPNSDLYAKSKSLEEKMEEVLARHQRQMKEHGAADRLLIAGGIEEILPLDDANLLDAVTPTSAKLDSVKLKAREDAQVKAVLEKGGVGLIVLGGSHDLSESVLRLGGGKCEYIRVTTKRFKEFGESRNNAEPE